MGETSNSVRSTLTEINSKLDKLIGAQEGIKETIKKHDAEIYGMAGTKDSLGIIRRLDGLGNKLDYIQRFAMIVWTAIFSLIQVAMTFIKHKGTNG